MILTTANIKHVVAQYLEAKKDLANLKANPVGKPWFTSYEDASTEESKQWQRDYSDYQFSVGYEENVIFGTTTEMANIEKEVGLGVLARRFPKEYPTILAMIREAN